MPDFTYTGSDVRTYYPPGAPAFEVVPGGTYTLAKEPDDGRWERNRETAKSAKSKPDPTPAPAGQSKE